MAQITGEKEKICSLEELQNSAKAAITRSEAANLLGVDPRTFSRGIEEGTIPAIRVGRRVVIPRVPFLQMLTGSATKAE